MTDAHASYAETFTSIVGDDTAPAIMDWVKSEMREELTSIPRIGRVTADCFKRAGIETSYALLGKFLSLKSAGCSPVEHCERFWIWVESATKENRIIKRDKAAICRCIFLKADILMPGLYEEDAYRG